jgi:hypothetical protein
MDRRMTIASNPQLYEAEDALQGIHSNNHGSNGRQIVHHRHPEHGHIMQARIEGSPRGSGNIILSFPRLNPCPCRSAYALKTSDVGVDGPEIRIYSEQALREKLREVGEVALGIRYIAPEWPFHPRPRQYPRTWLKVEVKIGEEYWTTRSAYLSIINDGTTHIRAHYYRAGQTPPPEPLPVARERAAERRRTQHTQESQELQNRGEGHGRLEVATQDGRNRQRQPRVQHVQTNEQSQDTSSVPELQQNILDAHTQQSTFGNRTLVIRQNAEGNPRRAQVQAHPQSTSEMQSSSENGRPQPPEQVSIFGQSFDQD